MTTLLINTVDQMNCYYISKQYSLPLEKDTPPKTQVAFGVWDGL